MNLLPLTPAIAMHRIFRAAVVYVSMVLPPLLFLAAPAAAAEDDRPPNVVIIFTDDQGYGDLGCFGSETLKTPRIDALADEGLRLTSFYVSTPYCSPSRAALLTGCYHKRISVNKVLFPGEAIGLNPQETTIAEMLQPRGYATACIGKWHLGDQPEFLPTRQGFDEFFGIPYSNDMYPQNNLRYKFPPLPLMQNEEVIETNPDQDELTQRLTDRAVDFIERSQDEPFFLYFAHPMPHRPCHASDEARRAVGLADREIPSYPQKTSDNDFVYPATMYDIDLSTGRIIDKLRELELERRTLVIFTSDNGPAVGDAGPLRGQKGSCLEGGMRVPCVVWWPGHVPAGESSDALTATIDLLPTIATVAGAELPEKRIDGVDLWPLLSGQQLAETPRETFCYYRGGTLEAIRSGDWKVWVNKGTPSLFDLGKDIRETRNVAAEHPEVVKQLSAAAEQMREQLGNGGRRGSQQRNYGRVGKPRTLTPLN